MSTAANIFTGVWQNYNDAAWPKWTLTLKQRDGGVLSAALVIFVGFAATQSWNIVKFMLHQARLRSKRDGLDQQLQAMLRNSSTHTHAAWFAIRIPLGWRRQRGLLYVLVRSSPVLIVSLVFITSWAAAQILLSRVWTDAGDEFLVNSGICSWVNMSDDFSTSSATVAYTRRRIESASAYVDLCYGATPNKTIQEASCQRLPRASIDWTMSDAPCPFADPSLCISTNSTPVTLDTGYLSSTAHFGVHTKRAESILYRRVANCSPVTTAYQASPEECVINFYYGKDEDSTLSDSEPIGLTFKYTDRPPSTDELLRSAYTMTAKSTHWKHNASFTDRDDVDPIIMFIINPVIYLQPNYDPIFRTSEHMEYDSAGHSSYNASAPVSILACLEQYEFCNPATPGFPVCTAVGSDSVETLSLSEEQLATLRRLVLIHQGATLNLAEANLFLASRSLFSGIQWAELPSTQWRRELSKWFSVGLAMIQQGFVDSATVPGNGLAFAGLSTNISIAAASCKRQIVRGVVGFQNFNMLAIVIVLVLGSIIIVIGLSIDSIVGLFQRRFRGASEALVHWTLDGVFQLQRLAYRGVGIRSWRDEDTYIPIVVTRDLPAVDRQTMAFAGCGSEEELTPEIDVRSWYEIQGR